MDWGNAFGGAASGAITGGSIGGPWGAAIGGGVGLLGSLLGGGDPYKKAQQASQQGFNQAQGIEQPFINQGQQQYAPLNQAREALMNPAQLENQWAQGYQNSPYAQQLLDMNRQQGLEAAGSMGLMGSSAALNNIQAGAGNITNQMRQQYLEDLMNKYMHGIGLGQNLYGTGSSMAGQLGQQAMGQGENMAQLGYGRAAAPGAAIGQAMGLASNNQMWHDLLNSRNPNMPPNPPAAPAAPAAPAPSQGFFGTVGNAGSSISSHLPQFLGGAA